MDRPGFVETAYGWFPGCSACGLISLTAPLLCEHGVTPAAALEFSCEVTVDDLRWFESLRPLRP